MLSQVNSAVSDNFQQTQISGESAEAQSGIHGEQLNHWQAATQKESATDSSSASDLARTSAPAESNGSAVHTLASNAALETPAQAIAEAIRRAAEQAAHRP